MLQLICHLFGDYFLQTDKMALNKKEKTRKGLLFCILHCTTYSIPFFLVTNWIGVILIGIGHFIMDRYHWLEHLIAIKNSVYNVQNFGFSADRPKLITVWLYIIHDNTFHLIWNYIVILLCNNLLK